MSIVADQLQYPNWWNELLKPGELVLWQGSPKPAGLMKTAVHALLFLVFLAFVIVIGWGAVQAKGTTIGTNHMILAGIFLAADLLYFYLAVIVFPGKARNTKYLMTNQRVIVKSKGLIKDLESYDLGRIVDWELQKKPDGSGTIYFASFSVTDPDLKGEQEEGSFQVELFGLENVDQVMMILQNAVAQARKQS